MAGSTTYPSSVDNKVQLTDGVDIIQADDVNDAYVPIDAIETFIGASGAGQPHNTDILAQLLEMAASIKISFVDVNTIQASAGAVVCQNAAGTLRKLRKNTSTTNITFSDLDTGSRATNTWYYVYAGADATATTVIFKISTSATTPTGLTTFRRIGRFRTNGVGSGEIIPQTVQSEWSPAQVGFDELDSNQSVGAEADLDVDVLFKPHHAKNPVLCIAHINITVPGTNCCGEAWITDNDTKVCRLQWGRAGQTGQQHSASMHRLFPQGLGDTNEHNFELRSHNFGDISTTHLGTTTNPLLTYLSVIEFRVYG